MDCILTTVLWDRLEFCQYRTKMERAWFWLYEPRRLGFSDIGLEWVDFL